jgi:hypothetical protein
MKIILADFLDECTSLCSRILSGCWIGRGFLVITFMLASLQRNGSKFLSHLQLSSNRRLNGYSLPNTVLENRNEEMYWSYSFFLLVYYLFTSCMSLRLIILKVKRKNINAVDSGADFWRIEKHSLFRQSEKILRAEETTYVVNFWNYDGDFRIIQSSLIWFDTLGDWYRKKVRKDDKLI